MQVPIELIREAACQIAREDFYSFCRLLYPKFYTDDKPHLKILCDTFQKFYQNEIIGSDGLPIQNLILNIAPRMGKSYTTQNFCKFLLGKDISASVINISYNQTLSMRAGKEVRNAIMERAITGARITYSDIFPGTKVREGDGAADVWSLEGSHFSYLSTSPTGTLTGIGTRMLILDDIVKDAYESSNDTILQNHYEWYTDTALSRVESGGKKLFIMTRWSTRDICGRVIQAEPGKWHIITMPACLNEDTHEMLCPSILSWEEYDDRRKKTDPQIFQANYNQKPYDSTDRLYTSFKEYDHRPEKFSQVCSYTDSADEGSDSLVSMVYGIADNTAYILDIMCTKKPMEVTEPALADMLTFHAVDRAYVESNNGGKGFARNVERLMRDKGNSKTQVEWFHQSQNKQARILSNATSIMNNVIFPIGWQYRWPEYHTEMSGMARSSRWTHDDCADATTGIIEKSLASAPFYFSL